MHNLPVHWSEGMFLRPQHFQAAERHWLELVASSQSWDNPYNYGLRHIELSEDAIRNFQVELSACRIRLRDGTVLEINQRNAPNRIDLKEAFQGSSTTMVYLAVPKLALGRANVAATRATNEHRFVATNLSVPDQSRGGGNQDIEFLDLNVRLLLSQDDQAGYEILPVARIKRAGEAEAIPQLDDDYFPPVIAIDAWDPLGLGTVRAIYDLIGQKINVLGQRVVERGTSLASQEPGDLEDLLMLSTLNGVNASLRCLAFADGVHPLIAYTELCRIVGMLSIFGPTRQAPEIPLYDHDDLARIFKWAKQQIELLLRGRGKLEYEQRFFVGTDRGMAVTIEPKWLHSGWHWFVGVLGENISERECRELLRPGHLDWKMGSTQQVDLIFKHGIPGVSVLELSQAPRALPSRQGWIYYEVNRDNTAWKDVLSTQSLAIRFKEELISNLEKLRGQQKVEISSGGKRSVLQFALFAVPPQTS
jgi:type VI secretion system protein ImpJ